LVIGPLIRWNGPSTVKTGENFRLALEVSSDVGITDFPLQIKYDKDVFELQDTSAGAFMTRDSAATDVGQRLVPRNGMIYLNQRQRRAGEAGRGALGNGNLAEIGFRALKASAGSRVTVLATDPLGVGGRPLGQVGPTTIDIRVAR
jgi:hypothetical protein